MHRKIVLVADNLSDADAAKVARDTEGWGSFIRLSSNSIEIPQVVAKADIVVGWTDPELLRTGNASTYLCGSAGIEAYAGHGLNIKPGFAMTNAAGVMSITIAEHCIAMMFALVRQIPAMIRKQGGKDFSRNWHGGEITGKSACIVGLGSAGTELAKRLAGLQMTVTGVRRSTGDVPATVTQLYPPNQLHAALKTADHVFCLLPGGPATKHLFDGKAFDAMRPGAFFYNASRGTIVDEAALIQRLNNNHLAGAGLDVFEQEPLDHSSPLWEIPNVLISPHSAGHSAMLASRLADLFALNLRNLREGRPLHNLVDRRLLQ